MIFIRYFNLKYLLNQIKKIYYSPSHYSSRIESNNSFVKEIIQNLNFEYAVSYEYSNGESTVEIPYINKDGKSFRANLLIRKSKGIDRAYLTVVFSSKKFFNGEKSNLEKDKKKFTGIVNFYVLEGQKIEGVQRYRFKKGKLEKIDRAVLNKGNNINARTSGWFEDFSEWWDEEWDDYWEFRDCFNEQQSPGDILSYAAAIVGCVEGSVTTLGFGYYIACGGATYGIYDIIETMHNCSD